MTEQNDNLEALEALFKTGYIKRPGDAEPDSAPETESPSRETVAEPADIATAEVVAEDVIETPAASEPENAVNAEMADVAEEALPEEQNEPDARTYTPKEKTAKKKPLFIDEKGEEKPNYTGDEVSERDYMPVRQSHEYRSGCLGGLMYFVFVTCCAVIIAVFAWMAASDMLALNKEAYAVEITLPTSIFHTETETVTDEKGNTTTKEVTYADIGYVAETLQSAGLIEYKWLFEFFCEISNASRKIDAGTYTLKSTFDYRALVTNMQTSSNRTLTVTVTIPEGYSMYDIFLKLEEAGVCSYDDLMEAAANHSYKYSFLDENSLGDASRLEGFLYPDTYEFYVGMQASSAINKFLKNFNEKLTEDLTERAAARNLTVKELLTVASLIEKEAAVDTSAGVDERRTVASVIYNRMKAGMSLGLESAILYIYPDYVGMPTAAMMQTDSPYNLNLYTGLPPTPICSPSMEAIEAALNPASTKYYYFTLDNATETHRFFTNYNDFLAFIAQQNAG